MCVARELEDAPIGPGALGGNEHPYYYALERAVHRHQFYDHDCQTVTCLAMFIFNSAELTALLQDAYARAERDIVLRIRAGVAHHLHEKRLRHLPTDDELRPVIKGRGEASSE